MEDTRNRVLKADPIVGTEKINPPEGGVFIVSRIEAVEISPFPEVDAVSSKVYDAPVDKKSVFMPRETPMEGRRTLSGNTPVTGEVLMLAILTAAEEEDTFQAVEVLDSAPMTPSNWTTSPILARLALIERDTDGAPTGAKEMSADAVSKSASSAAATVNWYVTFEERSPEEKRRVGPRSDTLASRPVQSDPNNEPENIRQLHLNESAPYAVLLIGVDPEASREMVWFPGTVRECPPAMDATRALLAM